LVGSRLEVPNEAGDGYVCPRFHRPAALTDALFAARHSDLETPGSDIADLIYGGACHRGGSIENVLHSSIADRCDTPLTRSILRPRSTGALPLTGHFDRHTRSVKKAALCRSPSSQCTHPLPKAHCRRYRRGDGEVSSSRRNSCRAAPFAPDPSKMRRQSPHLNRRKLAATAACSRYVALFAGTAIDIAGAFLSTFCHRTDLQSAQLPGLVTYLRCWSQRWRSRYQQNAGDEREARVSCVDQPRAAVARRARDRDVARVPEPVSRATDDARWSYPAVAPLPAPSRAARRLPD